MSTTWASANVNEKENLQKLIFPEGVTYNRKNGTFRTEKINEVLRCIATLNCITVGNEKGQIGNETNLSFCVGMAGQISNHFLKDLQFFSCK